MRALIVAALIAFGVCEAGAALPFLGGNPPGQRYIINGSSQAITAPLIVKSTTTSTSGIIIEALTNAGTSVFRALQSGFVGVGIDAPTSKLHIADGDIRISGTGNELIFSGPQNGQVGHSGFFDLLFYTNGLTRLSVTASGNFLFATNSTLTRNTADGSDTGYLQIGAGGDITTDRGAYVNLGGNEASGVSLAGKLQLLAGNVATGTIDLITGNAVTRMSINQAGDIGIKSGASLTLESGATSNFSSNFSSNAVTGTNGANTFVSNTGECATSTTTITTNGGDLRVTFTGAADSGGVDTAVGVGFLVNGAYVLGQTSTTGITRSVSPSASIAGNLSFSRRVRGLAAGSYDVCIYFRAPTTTASGLSPDEAVLELEEIR